MRAVGLGTLLGTCTALADDWSSARMLTARGGGKLPEDGAPAGAAMAGHTASAALGGLDDLPDDGAGPANAGADASVDAGAGMGSTRYQAPSARRMTGRADRHVDPGEGVVVANKSVWVANGRVSEAIGARALVGPADRHTDPNEVHVVRKGGSAATDKGRLEAGLDFDPEGGVDGMSGRALTGAASAHTNDEL